MTNREINEKITDKYLESIGYHRQSGVSLEVLEPILLMDLHYQIFNENINKVQCKHVANHTLKCWRKECADFFLKFNKAFEGDDFLAEQWENKMDKFEKYMQNQVMMVKVAIMDEFKQDDLRMQGLVADALLCQILADYAQIIRSRVFSRNMPRRCVIIQGQRFYEKRKIIAEPDESINRMAHYPTDWVTAYYRPTKKYNFNDNPKLDAAVDALEKRIVKFLVDDVNESNE